MTGIVIDLAFDTSQFKIADNAHGIPIAVAKDYAFRFGRPDDAPVVPGAVGEFGVGMKRALFKIGRHFTVTSHTASEFFTVDVDVDQWQLEEDRDPNGWTFPITDQGTNGNGTTGTTIVVDRLHDYAIEGFSSATFETRLLSMLKEAHAASLTRGLQITINHTPVLAQAPTLLMSQEIFPVNVSQTIEISGKEVRVRIICGVGETTLRDAGWYVYCNGRQIERAEKTEKTGWNSALGGDQTPRPHWQFRRFRGYLFFESNSIDVLPWNTTKTGLDVEAPAYRRVRADINSAMLQVIEFLNALDAQGEEGALQASVLAATPTALTALPPKETFIFTQSAAPPVKKPVRITYSKDPDLFAAVKDSLGAQTSREVGEQTFQYYVDSEDIDG